ncbi:MAG: neutral/alkaline non-lysosomal ceramidase N-terminal domain-containing protein [Opitutae bacterium]|nr:neutral/alkaline non-lysosomal ceramidase N-terminal domain-containing protein [Opitutae bacterium]
MKIGASQIDITPNIGGELSGFAARQQPSTGVLDPLWAKALYLTDGTRRLLWIHCDLIGFDAATVENFRRHAQAHLGLAPDQVMLSATHTHSGPSTIFLRGAGTFDPAYIAQLQQQLQTVAAQALAQPEECTVVTTESLLQLGIDRRNQPSRHTDPRIAGVGFRRADGRFIAALINYGIHPVALGHENRAVSRDILGATADTLSQRLPGRPLVLATNGACGNINPPAVGVDATQTMNWGRQIAEAIAPALLAAPAQPQPALQTARAICPLPLDVLDEAAIAVFVRKTVAGMPNSGFGEKLVRCVGEWQQGQVAALHSGKVLRQRDAELHLVQLADMTFLGANAEIFSAFTDWVRRDTGLPQVYTVGYANGNMGYISTRAAYAEGGYEVDQAHVFYGGDRFAPGSLEKLAQAAAALVSEHRPARR